MSSPPSPKPPDSTTTAVPTSATKAGSKSATAAIPSSINRLGERFVPNDTELDGSTRQIMFITGPNMAGKSTYIRQTALLALLAHTGSFVPAAQARIDRIDRIFSRVGASDDLSRGQSTFMVEMSETANILNNATAQPHRPRRNRPRHQHLRRPQPRLVHRRVPPPGGRRQDPVRHPLPRIDRARRTPPRLQNFNVAVREWRDQVVFLHKIMPGGTDKSYGIQVARLAGVPKSVIERAKEILRNLEESELTPEG
jgi:DNA mismatch repair protein MutS